MKSLIVILYLFGALISVFSQQNAHIVEYEYFPNPSLDPESMLIPTLLYIDNNISTYTMLLKDKKKQNIDKGDSQVITSGPGKYNLHMIQGKNSIFYEEKFWMGERVVFRDSLIHNWELQENTKSILGFTCYSATTKFRGRTYIAWYTPEIPLSYGPWKLNGLPGLILEAYSDDDRYRFRAVSYNNSPDNEQIEKWTKAYNFLDKQKKSNRSDYVKDVIEQYVRHDKSLQSSTVGAIDNYSTVVNIEEDLCYNLDKLE